MFCGCSVDGQMVTSLCHLLMQETLLSCRFKSAMFRARADLTWENCDFKASCQCQVVINDRVLTGTRCWWIITDWGLRPS